jgi:hypothetical protein
MLTIEGLQLHCGVSHCKNLAVTAAEIVVDVDFSTRKVLPVCADHAPEMMQAADGTKFDRKAALNDLKMLHGLPPHHGFNPCCGDGFFAASLPKKYGMPVAELEALLEIPRMLKEWSAISAEFSKRT